MKKLIAGTFVVMAIAAVVLDIQYAWKPDTLGKKLKQFNKLIHIETLSNRKGFFNICSSKFYKT